ncbi:MerR family transcriptional regulator [Agrobacterium salinitolerans]|uniref:MerR family transcriptional regulator n=1 Tax=Agrobacterium salinitolerans TaxID=1183413 RepID=UPI001572970E|nr:MerR family transcriptional regulator [Agrobacterium salinitolerans]NTA35987.1 MerR family transcriptional regulator [Agrobacterium salinitolerans]
MSHDFTVGDASRLIGVEPSRIRNWQQHKFIEFGTRGITGRYRFTLRDVRCLALMARLVDRGIEPSRAAKHAETIVDRIGSRSAAPYAAVVSPEPGMSPCVIPEDSPPLAETLIVIPTAPLFRSIDARIAR